MWHVLVDEQPVLSLGAELEQSDQVYMVNIPIALISRLGDLTTERK
jgi:hypothetical protein